ncbi:hypothetical protein [Burkholderia sp. KBS0801]|uniref:hypothetical protein n=1 Tax=Burkholderia sp. KBS0801 TaxID=1179675 RepID=UPI001643C1D4|nr:hypothetical protein [Burkholderia sp. KBS0801]
MARTSKYAVAGEFTWFEDLAFACDPRGVAAFASITAGIQLVAYASIIDRTGAPENA